jgi:hypothetical protein
MKLSHDPMNVHEARIFVESLMQNITYDKLTAITNNQLDAAWRSWITNSSYHKITGLDKMPYSCFCPGVTDVFGEFIARYPNRRVRVSRSDFVLTRILCQSWSKNWLPIEEGALDSDDCLIMSLPFSGNGSYYPEWTNLLNQAESMAVPVLIDGAYFGISKDIDYALHHECVKDFAISLSKNLVGNPLRLGIRFTRDNVDDGISAGLIGSDIFDRLGAYLSINLLEKFPHDWFVEKYQNFSIEICNKLNLKPTNTLTLAIGPNTMQEFKRGDYIRVSISNELSKLS